MTQIGNGPITPKVNVDGVTPTETIATQETLVGGTNKKTTVATDGLESSQGIDVEGHDISLNTGTGFTTETLKQMDKLIELGGEFVGDLAEMGDVDFPFLSMSSASLNVTGFTQSNIDNLQPVITEIANFSVSYSGVSAPPGSVGTNFEAVVSDVASSGAGFDSGDVNALVQWVLRESYLETTNDLKMYAEKVKHYNEVKKEIRAELDRARNALTDVAGQDETASLPAQFIPNEISSDFVKADAPVNTGPGETSESEPAVDPAQLAADIAAWEAQNRTTRGASNIRYATDYHDSSDYANFDKQINKTVEETLAQLDGMSPQEREALMEQIRADGGVNIHNHVYDTDKKNEHYNRDKRIAPRPNETLEAYLDRAIREAGADFKGWVHDEEGSINMHGFDTTIRLPAHTFTPPLPPELGGSNSAQSAGEYAPGEPITNKAKLDGYIKSLEEKLSGTGDDAQLANVDLQNVLQKQQQTIQMMSNIGKMLHDTAMSVIRKIGG